MSKKIIVGLTGGIASGKSAAAQMFESAGAYIIDTDVVSRRVSESGECKRALMSAFPEAFEGGELNRRKLREIVFNSDLKREKLNSVMHPLIFKETEREIAGVSGKPDSPRVIAVVVPLLFETGYNRFTDVNVAVSCDENTRIERLKKRDNITDSLARQMVNAQMSESERNARADTVIDNNGSLAQLRAQVVRVYLELTDRP